MPRHARLSPSSAKRWINCPASVILSEGIADKGSVYAREGTLAHELAELKLLFYTGTIEPHEFEIRHRILKTHELYDPEMEEHTDSYFSEIGNVINAINEKEGSEPTVLTEQTYPIDLGLDEDACFGTADCVVLSDKEMHIFDFKYGKGVEVSAGHNEQLMLYAVGALQAYDLIYDPEAVTIHIIQPRLNNFCQDSFTKEELKDWIENVVSPSAKEAIEGTDRQALGEWCMFCKAKAKCRLKNSQFDFIKRGEVKTPPQITDSEVGEMIKLLRPAVSQLKALEDYALHALMEGAEIDGFKVVEGRSVRSFKDQREAFRLAQEEGGIKAEMLYEKKPVTLTSLEKMLGKKKFNELLGDLVDRPQGKPTLVEESDKRVAINKPTVLDVFKNIEIKGDN